MGRLYITDPKEGEPKYIPLVPEDVNLLKSLKDSDVEVFPEMPLFRHIKGNGGAKHTSIIHMRNVLKRSKSECKEASGHSTNKAFERYCDVTDNTLRELSQDGRNLDGMSGTEPAPIISVQK